MLASERHRLIRDTLRQLAATHAAAVAEIEETMKTLAQAIDFDDSDGGVSDSPVIDFATFTVRWRGEACFLGNTLLFLLFARLARSPNKYVPHVELLDDVWQCDRQASTIRGVVKRLREHLSDAGMEDLAASIDGTVSGHYGLILV